MADFCKQCTQELFSKELADIINLDFPPNCLKNSAYIILLCEGCGRNIRVLHDGYRAECNTCFYGDEGTCGNCFGVEGHTTEISGTGICQNFKRKINE